MLPNDLNVPQRPRIYLAGPLFSDAERTFNELVARRLDEWADVYLPQRDGGLMSQMVQSGIPAEVAACRVFRRDLEAIHRAKYVIAILDGRAIDEGVAFEIGIAYSNLKRCIGLQTDSRRLASWGNNPMITGALDMVFHTLEELVGWVSSDVSAMSAAPNARTVWVPGQALVPDSDRRGLQQG